MTTVDSGLANLHVTSTGGYSGFHMASLFDNGLAVASGAWPAANRAIYVPLYLPHDAVVARFFVMNGSNVTGTVDMAVLDQDYTKLVSTGNVARAGTSQVQYYDVTDYYLRAGNYYLGLVSSSATGAFGGQNSLTAMSTLWLMGVTNENLASAVIPTQASPVRAITGYIPAFGFTQSNTL